MARLSLDRENTKGDFLVGFFRLSSAASRFRVRALGLPVRFLYRLIVRWILCVDVPDTLIVGKGLRIFHGMGLVIHEKTLIGDHVTIRQNTTIGTAREGGSVPRIGNFVDIGANSIIIGDVTVGDHSIVAAGAVVIRNVPPRVVVAGNPARIVKVLAE